MGRELDRWLALALTLVVFADLHYVLTASPYLLYNDFLRLLAYALLLVGVWQAYGHAEFGRAVAEERARVARDIHDGLAQYLFAISAHVSMLEAGSRPGRGAAPAQAGGRRGAAGGELRRARALLGERDRALRRRAPPLRRVAHWRREAGRRARHRPDRTARARRADRDLPDRAGGPVERATTRRCRSRGCDDRQPCGADASWSSRTTASASTATPSRARASGTCASGPHRSTEASRSAPLPGRGTAIEVVLRPA